MQVTGHKRSRRVAAVAYGIGFLCLSLARAVADEALLPPMNGQASDFAQRRAGFEVGADIRIAVTNAGVCRITRTALTNAGVAAETLVGATIRLFCRTQEVALCVSSAGLWTTNDYLLFPGSGYDGAYSATNIYWLGFGSDGKRMGSRGAAPAAGGAAVHSYRKTVTHHVRYWLKDLYRWNDESFDHWTDNLTIRDTAANTYTHATDQVVPGDAVNFSAVLYGYTSLDAVNPDHCTRIRVNGSTIAQHFYDGQVTATVATNFAGSLLQAVNSVSMQQVLQSGVPSDSAYLHSFSMTYSRLLVQERNALLFGGRAGTNTYQVGGFTGGTSVFVFDITDPANAVVLTGCQTTNTGGGAYAVRFSDRTVSPARYAVASASGLIGAASIQKVAFRNLADTNRCADYVVICPYAFRQPVYRLLTLRYGQGLSVAVAPLPDLFNEFSYGIADAAAIKQFLGFAFHHWKTPPRYVLLAGAGTSDPRRHNYLSTFPDIIPVHMGSGYMSWTALDGWYATVNGVDNVPDLAIGRIPVETEAQMGNVVDRIVAFEAVPADRAWRTEAMLVADNNDVGYDFTGASDFVWTHDLDPNGFSTTPAYKGTPGGSSAAIVNAINAGTFIVNYFGHGSIDLWSASPSLLTTANVAGLHNSPYYPIVSMLTCQNGAFQSPSTKCLVETFLEGANRGAGACLASSGLSTFAGCRSLARGFYQTVLTERKPRIGDALLPAYSSLYLQNGNTRELLFFELFGDPALLVNPP